MLRVTVSAGGKTNIAAMWFWGEKEEGGKKKTIHILV